MMVGSKSSLMEGMALFVNLPGITIYLRLCAECLGIRGTPIHWHRFGNGTSNVLLTHVDCNGKENSIFTCKYQTAKKKSIDCRRVAVRCK